MINDDKSPSDPQAPNERPMSPLDKARERNNRPEARAARLAARKPPSDDDGYCPPGAIGDYRQSAPDAPEKPEPERWPLSQDQTSFGYGVLEQPVAFSQPERKLSPLEKAHARMNTPEDRAKRLVAQQTRSRDYGMER